MNNLKTVDLKLALADLLDNPKRFDPFKGTATYTIYGALLAEKRQAIHALPPSLVSDTPLAEQLSETDKRHDGLGKAFYHQMLAILTHPDATAEQQAVAQKAQQTFLPQLGLLQKSYADEAARARDNRKQLPEQQPGLAALPTPLGNTAADWLDSFVQEGEKLDQLLSDRALIGAHAESAGKVAGLRPSTIGVLGDVRRSLTAEVKSNSALPRNLVAIVFGYFDLLNVFRTKEPAGAKPPEPPPVEPPAPAEQ